MNHLLKIFKNFHTIFEDILRVLINKTSVGETSGRLCDKKKEFKRKNYTQKDARSATPAAFDTNPVCTKRHREKARVKLEIKNTDRGIPFRS